MIFFLSIIRSVIDFTLSYWKQIAIAILLAMAVYMIRENGYNSGYKNRTVYYEKILAKQHEDLVAKIDRLEAQSSDLSNTSRKNHDKLVLDLNTLTKDMKSKKFYIVKDGECTPSKEFSDSYNSIISRANRK